MRAAECEKVSYNDFKAFRLFRVVTSVCQLRGSFNLRLAVLKIFLTFPNDTVAGIFSARLARSEAKSHFGILLQWFDNCLALTGADC